MTLSEGARCKCRMPDGSERLVTIITIREFDPPTASPADVSPAKNPGLERVGILVKPDHSKQHFTATPDQLTPI